VSHASFWIFGYGSLVWRPAFPHLRSCPASIRGFARRFWQGSTDHRGTPDRPGRVVTLLPEQHECLGRRDALSAQSCWGTAYEVPGGDPEKVLVGLDHRERGGYDRVDVEIMLFEEALPTRGREEIRAPEARAVAGLVYIAGPENTNYLGSASIEDIAGQIVSSSGPSGPNPEYVFELARGLRKMGADDAHVFAVEAEVMRLLSEKPPRFE
jgi:cation transport regulator ChaC